MSETRPEREERTDNVVRIELPVRYTADWLEYIGALRNANPHNYLIDNIIEQVERQKLVRAEPDLGVVMFDKNGQEWVLNSRGTWGCTTASYPPHEWRRLWSLYGPLTELEETSP